jgi:uncharacterized protein YjiS (DUF1127 family)
VNPLVVSPRTQSLTPLRIAQLAALVEYAACAAGAALAGAIRRFGQAIEAARAQRRSAVELGALSERELRDIGLTRHDVSRTARGDYPF